MSPEYPHDAPTDVSQRAFLLNQIAAAPGRRMSRGDANGRIPVPVAREFGLTPAEANRLRDALVADGLLSVEKRGRVATYALTDAGAAHLDTVRDRIPGPPPRGKIHPLADEPTRRDRVSCLLLQLLKAGRPLTAAEANRFTSYERDANKGLGLNAATAAQIRRDLVAGGLVAVTRNGRTENYAITPEGRQRLGTLVFCKDFPVTLPSSALNDLLDAARDAAKAFEAPARPPSAGVAAGGVEAVVLSAFDELRRERHAVSGLVPVHEVRAAVRERLGPAAARHDVFDEAVLGLWRAKRLRLSAIADHGHATPDQLQDSIPGVGETLFYLRGAHEPAAV